MVSPLVGIIVSGVYLNLIVATTFPTLTAVAETLNPLSTLNSVIGTSRTSIHALFFHILTNIDATRKPTPPAATIARSIISNFLIGPDVRQLLRILLMESLRPLAFLVCVLVLFFFLRVRDSEAPDGWWLRGSALLFSSLLSSMLDCPLSSRRVRIAFHHGVILC